MTTLNKCAWNFIPWGMWRLRMLSYSQDPLWGEWGAVTLWLHSLLNSQSTFYVLHLICISLPCEYLASTKWTEMKKLVSLWAGNNLSELKTGHFSCCKLSIGLSLTSESPRLPLGNRILFPDFDLPFFFVFPLNTQVSSFLFTFEKLSHYFLDHIMARGFHQ